MFTIADVPWWYITFAVLVSSYQAFRGYRLQALMGAGQGVWGAADRMWLLCIADAFTYFTCSLSGFYSLLLFFRGATDHSAAATVGHPASLIFLALYGVMGITAKLPEALNKLQLK